MRPLPVQCLCDLQTNVSQTSLTPPAYGLHPFRKNSAPREVAQADVKCLRALPCVLPPVYKIDEVGEGGKG